MFLNVGLTGQYCMWMFLDLYVFNILLAISGMTMLLSGSSEQRMLTRVYCLMMCDECKQCLPSGEDLMVDIVGLSWLPFETCGYLTF